MVPPSRKKAKGFSAAITVLQRSFDTDTIKPCEDALKKKKRTRVSPQKRKRCFYFFKKKERKKKKTNPDNSVGAVDLADLLEGFVQPSRMRGNQIVWKRILRVVVELS